MRKFRIIILFIVAIILGLLAGYAITNVSGNIETKTSPSKTIDVDFVKIGKLEEVGSSGASATISADKDYVSIEIPNLQYIGAYAKVPITIKNVGLLPAKLKWINEYGINTNKTINVTYSGLGVTDKVLLPGETSNIIVTIRWNKEMKYINDNDTYFRINLYYEQG